MPTLNDLGSAVVTRLQASQAGGGSLASASAAVVVAEDCHDLAAEVTKAFGRIGMMILVGMPHFVNRAECTNPNVQAVIQFAVAVGENPPVWRVANPDGGTRPYAPAVAQIVAQLLQNFQVPGFKFIRVVRVDYVPDKKRQLYEVALETLLIAPTLQN